MRQATNGKIQIGLGVLLLLFSVGWGLYILDTYIAEFHKANAELGLNWNKESLANPNLDGHVASSLVLLTTVFSNISYLFITVIILMIFLGIKFILDGLALMKK